MTAYISNHTVSPLSAVQKEGMEYYTASTLTESTQDTVDSFFLGWDQYMFSPEVDLFSLGMLPSLTAVDAYCDFGELTENTVLPHIAMASMPIAGLPPSQYMLAIEGMPPFTGVSVSTGSERPLRENSSVKISHDADAEVQCSGSREGSKLGEKLKRQAKSRQTTRKVRQEPSLEEIERIMKEAATEGERHNLALQRRRIQRRNAQIAHRQRRKAEREELLKEREILLARQSELEEKVLFFQQQVTTLTRENAVLRQERIYNVKQESDAL